MKRSTTSNTRKNSGKAGSRELWLSFAEFLVIDGMISFIFYRSILPFFGFFLFFPKYQKYRKKTRREKRKRELAAQFRESIQAVSTSLNAGYSVENAFVEAYGDMKQTYGEDAPIVIEYRRIAERLKNNEAIEVILKDFALRSGVEDIRDFSDVFSAAKRSGGDMGKIIRRASGNISEKMEVKREIDTLISSKRYEQRIMEIVPFAIIAYLSVISPGFMDGLYHNPIGIAVMSACLGIYAGGFLLAEKIMRIEV